MKWYLGSAFLWLIYFPILSTLKWVFFFIPKVRLRIEFEMNNKTEEGVEVLNKMALRPIFVLNFPVKVSSNKWQA